MCKQLAFYFEQNYCVGCNTCQIACRDKNNLNMEQQFRKVYEITGGEFEFEENAIIPKIYAFWVSVSCNHCINPICVSSCPTKAMIKRSEDGIVYIDERKCIGCKICIKSCPYKAPQYNSVSRKVEKCDFCIDFLKQGKEPVCISSCPMRALGYGQLDKLQEKFGEYSYIKGIEIKDTLKPALVITPHEDAIKCK